MVGLCHWTKHEDVVNGRGTGCALDDGVIGGRTGGDDAEVVVEGPRGKRKEAKGESGASVLLRSPKGKPCLG